MKKIITTFIILLALCSFMAIKIHAQASFELQSRGADEQSYVTLKGFQINENEKYPYMFSNLGFYRILIKNAAQNDNQISIKIYDKDEREVASNFDPQTRKYVHNFAFSCGKTGVYYVKFDDVTN